MASPGCDVIARFAEAGADVLYILTGRREWGPSRLNDRERLRLAIEAVEEWLAERPAGLPPQRKAELIAAAYDLLKSPAEDKARVVELLRRAA